MRSAGGALWDGRQNFFAGSGPLKNAKKCRGQVLEWLKSVKPGGTPLNLQECVEHQVSHMKGCRGGGVTFSADAGSLANLVRQAEKISLEKA